MKHIVIDARIRRASTGRYVDRLLKHLQVIDSTNRYSVLVEPDDDWQPTAQNFSAISCKFKRFPTNPLEQITFARWLKKLRPDLVHFTMTPQQPIFYRGKNIVTTMDFTMFYHTRAHGLTRLIHWLRMLVYRFLFWHSNKNADKILTISNYVKNRLEKTYPFTAGKITTTHCASEPELSNKVTPMKSIQKPFILYVGSAFPHKNLSTLVDAFSILAKDHKDLRLVLAGKKEYYYEQLEKYAKSSDVSDRITFTGFVSDSELKWLYKNAEAYVFPSLSEGFGLPGLEAMVHGCPVVSSNATCLPEINGDAALYFDPKDPANIATKVDELLGNTALREKLIARGFIQAKKFSWRRMAEETLEIYKKILS